MRTEKELQRKVLLCVGGILLVLELLLGLAHLFWPEYKWGQGRSSYFNFDNSLTLASWLASMQFFALSVVAIIAFHRVKQGMGERVMWLFGVITALGMSFTEMTRIPSRLNLLGYPWDNPYQQMIVFAVGITFLALFGIFLLDRLKRLPLYRLFCEIGMVLWGGFLGWGRFESAVPERWGLWFSLISGLLYLSGGTFFLLSVAGYAFRAESQDIDSGERREETEDYFKENRKWLYIAVLLTSFIFLFLEILLFRFLLIFSDYVTANSIIAIALVGGAFGGLIGYFTVERVPFESLLISGFMLPVSIILVMGTTVVLMDYGVLASVLLMVPFVCTSVIISVILAKLRENIAYFMVLLGSAAGTLFVNSALYHFREENSILLLAAASLLIPLCSLVHCRSGRTRFLLISLAGFGIVFFLGFAEVSLRNDTLNIVKTKLHSKYPEAEFLFSRSSYISRYDIVKRTPSSGTLKAYENGRTIDTIRNRTADKYNVDPRLPHTFPEKPVVLIIGLSGDGITKTAKNLGRKVYGVEINPVVVELQRNELKRYNGNSYEGIEVAVIDGRSYVEQDRGKYDIITFLNAHFALGPVRGRAPSPEFLYTKEAFHRYLDRLSDTGAIIIEEPISFSPLREVPLYKLLYTMRETLQERGVKHPEDHFFVFQWRTRVNNYLQIFMKKNPLTGEDITNLLKWLKDCDRVRDIHRKLGRKIIGPIHSKTTLLYSPDKDFETNYSRILKGNASKEFLKVHNIYTMTDDKPFLFDTHPGHPSSLRAYNKILILVFPLFIFCALYLRRGGDGSIGSLPYLLIVILTGFGFLLVEVVLIQNYEIFLGAPFITFTCVVGTLLLASGVGSYWSGRLERREVLLSVLLVIILLLLQQYSIPRLFSLAVSSPLQLKIIIAVVSLAPLGFFMGIPFPYIIRQGKSFFSERTAAVLYAANTSASAIAVPLAMVLSMTWGFRASYGMGILVYAVVLLIIFGLDKKKLLTVSNMSGILLIGTLLFLPWLNRQAAEYEEIIAKDTKIFAIQYGRSRYKESKVLLTGLESEKVKFDWAFWLIRTRSGRNILVDCGFEDARKARRFRIKDFVNPIERLKQIGLSPDEIDDVIVTHAHWDHIGTLSAFKNARVWIQKKEYDYAKARVNGKKKERGGILWKDVQTLRAAEKAGRLIVVEGDTQVTEGVNLTLAGGHTPGSQYVIVGTLDGNVILAGDNTYLYKNNQEHIPSGTAYSREECLAAIRKMHEKAGSTYLIIPGHDPRVMRYFPEVSDDIVQITTYRGED